jgi:NADH-quinone oxidoreductase subunit D
MEIVTENKEFALKTEPFCLNIGPAHPSTHGVFRIKATLDGEVIVGLEPVFGYLHRGIEKLAEQRTYNGITPLTDRLDYLAAMSNNLAHCIAIEKLAGIKVPERAEYRLSWPNCKESPAISSRSALLAECGAFMTPIPICLGARKVLDF